jgi:bifunctional diaminopimelate decarboxylase / aspartate kinase
VRELFGPDVPILFTPNFCHLDEYADAYALGAEVTVDGPESLLARPDIFAGKDVAVRIDPGQGDGHCDKVITAGPEQKFGHPIDDLPAFAAAVASVGARVTGYVLF